MEEVNTRIYIVDRVDQVKWYVDESQATTFTLQLEDNHKAIREWLELMTQDIVVISGQGVMPRVGTADHPTNVYAAIQRNQYRLYFANPDDAMLFKLRWGGE
jgi:hypothetical protein